MEMKTFREFLNESASKIADRLEKYIKEKEIYYNSLLIETYTDKVIKFDYKIISTLTTVRSFEDSFISDLHTTSLNLKKINLNRLSNSEFIEWLDKFMRSYKTVLYTNMSNYFIKINIQGFKEDGLIPPNRLKELVQEFDLFVEAIRLIFKEEHELVQRLEKRRFLPDKKVDTTLILSGKDVNRIMTSDYSLKKLVNQMIEPEIIVLESGVIESEEIWKS